MKSQIGIKVSIIVPVYNRENLLKRLLATVKKQSFQQWELLLIDDNSTDGSYEVAKAASHEDKRIICAINKYSKGPSGARNTGLDLASGDYIAYQDSDDEWVEYHLETMVYYLDRYRDQIDVMTANPLRKREDTGEIFNYDELFLENMPWFRMENGYLIDPSAIFDLQLRGRVVTTQCLVGKAEIMKSVRWDENLVAAVDIMHNLELCAKKIFVCHLQDFHAIYWAHGDNLTDVSGSHNPERMERVHWAFATYWKSVLKKFDLRSDQKRYVKSELSNVLAWHLGYHTYEPQKKYIDAGRCYFQAIYFYPLNFKFYTSLLKVLIKSIFR